MHVENITIIIGAEEQNLIIDTVRDFPYSDFTNLNDEADKIKLNYRNRDTVIIEAVDYKKHVTIDEIDDVVNEIMDVYRAITGTDSDSDEDDEIYTIVYQTARDAFDQSEFVDNFENVADGVELIKRLHQDNAPDISKKEFAADLHFSEQTPFYKIEAAVRQFVGDEE